MTFKNGSTTLGTINDITAVTNQTLSGVCTYDIAITSSAVNITLKSIKQNINVIATFGTNDVNLTILSTINNYD